jgi:hypothetical protein
MQKGLLVLIPLLGIAVVANVAQAEERSGLFPLGKSWAGDAELPRPFGIGLSLYRQEQGYDLKSLTVNLPNVGLAEAAGVKVENETVEGHLKLDLWLLPFFNVFGIVGRVEGETMVEPGPPLSQIEVDYEGTVYGGGGTVGIGGKRLFGSLSATYTGTELDTATSSVEAWVVTPRVGVRVKGIAFWVGAMYQDAEERHRGNISLPFFGSVTYDVELEEEEPWNYTAGLRAELGKHWELELEGGFGERKHALVSVGYRF